MAVRAIPAVAYVCPGDLDANWALSRSTRVVKGRIIGVVTTPSKEEIDQFLRRGGGSLFRIDGDATIKISRTIKGVPEETIHVFMPCIKFGEGADVLVFVTTVPWSTSILYAIKVAPASTADNKALTASPTAGLESEAILAAEDPRTVYAGVAMYRELKAEDAVPTLRRWASSDKLSLRYAAISQLVRLGSIRSLAEMIRILESNAFNRPEENCTKAVNRAKYEFEEALEYVADPLHHHKEKFSPEYAPMIGVLLKHRDWRVKGEALSALLPFRWPGAIKFAEDQLGDADPQTRYRAQEYICTIASPDVKKCVKSIERHQAAETTIAEADELYRKWSTQGSRPQILSVRAD